MPIENPPSFQEAVLREASLGYNPKDESVNIECVRATAEDFEAMMEARGLTSSSSVWIDNFNHVYQLFKPALDAILIKEEVMGMMWIQSDLRTRLNDYLSVISVLTKNLEGHIAEAAQYYIQVSVPTIPDELKKKFRAEFQGFHEFIPKYLEALEEYKPLKK